MPGTVVNGQVVKWLNGRAGEGGVEEGCRKLQGTGGKWVVVADGDEFGGDGNGDFGGCDRADRQANRGMDFGQSFERDALLVDVLEDGEDFSFGADEAEVFGARVDDRRERLSIAAMAAGDNDDVGERVDGKLLQLCFDVADDVLVCFGKARLGRVIRAVIKDGDLEIEIRGEVGEGMPNVARAGDEEDRRWHQWLDVFGVRRWQSDAEFGGLPRPNGVCDLLERGSVGGRGEDLDVDVHGSTADQAIIPAQVVVEFEGEKLGLVGLDLLEGGGADFRFNASAAEGADGLARLQDQHLGAFFLRAGALGFDEGAEGERKRVGAEGFEDAGHKNIVGSARDLVNGNW